MKAAVAWAALLVAGCLGPAPDTVRPPTTTDALGLDFHLIVEGLERPVDLVPLPGPDGLFLLAEQVGRIRVLDGRAVRPTPFLDIAAKVTTAGAEQGLLGIALHPDFSVNGHVYVHYNDRDGDTVVERYTRLSGEPLVAAPASAKTILTVDQPYANHNGGQITFGPDGFLWIALGDGGNAGDPHGNAQDKSTLLGKILRIDVDSGDPYAIPADNPFRASSDARAEIWAFGLRNPWRFSFDRANGDLYIADVGQNEWEEVNHEPAGSGGGRNYGWNVYEGSHPYRSGAPIEHSPPVAEYANEGRHCAVTGGYVYRGSTVPALVGRYLFGDYCSGSLWTLHRANGSWALTTLPSVSARISAFAQDENGELYLLDHDGRVLRVAPP